jgi:hypothetical protein
MPVRVYAALVAFGAPLDAFEVKAEDFCSYDGILQLGLPPRRIDIINHAADVKALESAAGPEGGASLNRP